MNRTLLFSEYNLCDENNFHSSPDNTCVLWFGSYHLQFTHIVVLLFPQEFFDSLFFAFMSLLVVFFSYCSVDVSILILSNFEVALALLVSNLVQQECICRSKLSPLSLCCVCINAGWGDTLWTECVPVVQNFWDKVPRLVCHSKPP